MAIALVALLVLSPNKAQAQDGTPVADAGPSRYAGPDPIVLDGTRSYDPDNSGSLNYTWRQISGPSVVIIDENTAMPTIAGSIQPGTGRDPTPKATGFPQTEEVQECEFELVVSDGERTSLPDSVKVIIVPNFGSSTLKLENPSFDVNKPTVIYFGGGDCTNGLSGQPWNGGPAWMNKANVIDFPSGYTRDSGGGMPTFYKYGDMIIVYLSAVALDYRQPIQTIGWSTGADPAIDVGIRLNGTYGDARYAVNRVTQLDGGCRIAEGWSVYLEAVQLFLTSSVDGEQHWIDHYYGTSGYASEPAPHSDILLVRTGFAHNEVPNWYRNSLTGSDMNNFHNGVVGGAYWSVIGPGKNLQLTPETGVYYFQWNGNAQTGAMDFFSPLEYPGRLPEPVTLVGPVDIGDPNGFVFTCEESENAVGYELLFGTDPDRIMDYEIISDTPAPPNDVITTIPSDGIWWTVRVRDQYGSTIYADPKYFSLTDPNDTVEVNEENDGKQVELDLGQILVVTLESNPSTGYRWEVAETNESILEQLGEAEFRPSDTGDPPLVGAGGWEIFRFKAGSPGQMVLNLVYRRPWEDVEPLKTFSIEVIVN